ncbi:MAG: LamG domain-containing protein, partial [Phycisphaerae bacterium]|nr:LamG domain-containing protein [Phycisphaerae bacterium]
TLYGRGRDIWGRHDEFYYLSQYPFVGNGSIQAQVLSIDNTDPWAKAGVMIREKWTPYSKFAAVFMTPGQGVAFQYRDVEDGPAVTVTKPGVTSPQYVRLVRNIDGSFEAKHSDNPFVWQDVNVPGSAPVFPVIGMGTIDDPNIYVGSAVSSHNANQICAADLNDLLISPLPPNWIFGNIGTNDPEQLYIALSDGVNTSVVEHNDVNAATLTSWQEWNIALSEFPTVNPDGIKKVYIGLGDRSAPVQGGSGAIYVDDIRACPPRCVPALAKPLYDIAQPYDCIVNERDLALVGVDWLLRDEVITTQIPGVGPIAQYLFEGNYLDSAGTNHGDPCGSPVIVVDPARGNVVDLDGSSWVSTDANAIDLGIDGNTPKTVTAWAYTRSFNNGGIFDMGNYVAGQNFCLRTLTTDNLWRTQLWGGADMDFTYDSLDKWVHFALVDEGSQTTVYADGVIVAQGARNLATAGTVPFRIGQYNVANYFNGRSDYVRIYNYGLSQAEVAYIVTDGAGTLHLPIVSVADVYQGETPGNQWINFKDYALIADKYLEEILWPAP